MKDRTKEIIKDGFGSLISNAAAIRGAKAGPLWLTIVMFILSIFLPVVPIFVAQVNTNGSTFLTSYSYGLERYVTAMAMDLENNRNAKFIISEDHLLSIKEDGNDINFNDFGSEKPYAAYVNDVTKQYDLLLFISTASTDKEKSTFNSLITATSYVKGSTNKADENTESAYRANYIILFENGVYVCIYGSNSTKALTYSYSGDFKTIKANNDCLKTLLTVTTKDGAEYVPDLANDDYTTGVYKNFKVFLNRSYDTLKIKNTLGMSGIYLGVFFGVCVLMGFIMWILTRGKNNPNNYYSPWLTMKIQARMALAPALITLIVGFFLTSYAPIIFISTVGLRVMWVSMKELRPIQQ